MRSFLFSIYFLFIFYLTSIHSNYVLTLIDEFCCFLFNSLIPGSACCALFFAGHRKKLCFFLTRCGSPSRGAEVIVREYLESEVAGLVHPCRAYEDAPVF